MDCRKEGREAGNPVRNLLENPSQRGSDTQGERRPREGGGTVKNTGKVRLQVVDCTLR